VLINPHNLRSVAQISQSGRPRPWSCRCALYQQPLHADAEVLIRKAHLLQRSGEHSDLGPRLCSTLLVGSRRRSS
jgi:hypothetical protein